MEAAHQVGMLRGHRDKVDPARPNLAVAMFAAAVPAMIALQALTVALIFAIVPVGDLAPVLVLVIAAVSRRWRGVSETWLRVAQGLSVFMLAQWLILYAAFFAAQVSTWESDLSFVFFEFGLGFYALESMTLLAVVAVASALSITGLLRRRTDV